MLRQFVTPACRVTWPLALAVSVAGAQTLPLADPPMTLPERVAQCQACHGASGKPDDESFPIIGGQNRAYLVLALQALRDGQRGGGNAATMQPFAQGLTDEQIDELAGFFAGLRNLR